MSSDTVLEHGQSLNCGVKEISGFCLDFHQVVRTQGQERAEGQAWQAHSTERKVWLRGKS